MYIGERRAYFLLDLSIYLYLLKVGAKKTMVGWEGMYNEVGTCFAIVLSLILDLMDCSHIGVNMSATLLIVITIQTTQLFVGKYTM
jgi:hypothetical protein